MPRPNKYFTFEFRTFFFNISIAHKRLSRGICRHGHGCACYYVFEDNVFIVQNRNCTAKTSDMPNVPVHKAADGHDDNLCDKIPSDNDCAKKVQTRSAANVSKRNAKPRDGPKRIPGQDDQRRNFDVSRNSLNRRYRLNARNCTNELQRALKKDYHERFLDSSSRDDASFELDTWSDFAKSSLAAVKVVLVPRFCRDCSSNRR